VTGQNRRRKAFLVATHEAQPVLNPSWKSELMSMPNWKENHAQLVSTSICESVKIAKLDVRRVKRLFLASLIARTADTIQ
jgi:hypothetical protein